MTARLLLTMVLALALESPVATAASEPGKAQPSAASTSASQTSPFNELRLRRDISERVEKLLLARDYAAIDEMERTLRLSGRKTPSGIPELYELHAAIQQAFGGLDPSTDCRVAGEDQLNEWRLASPKSPTPYITRSAVLMMQAWCWRGGGHAQEVSEEGWSKFHAEVAAAEALLVANKKIAAVDPQYYVVMEDIYQAEGRSRSDFEALLKEATATDAYYYPIYWYAYYYNQPQWFGSAADIEAAARFAVERTRAKDGLGAYARYYWNASAGSCDCWTEAIDWGTMKTAMRDLAERYPDPWNLANFAKLGCTFNDSEVARTYFDKLGTDDGRSAWDDESSWQECRKLAGIEVAQR